MNFALSHTAWLYNYAIFVYGSLLNNDVAKNMIHELVKSELSYGFFITDFVTVRHFLREDDFVEQKSFSEFV